MKDKRVRKGGSEDKRRKKREECMKGIFRGIKTSGTGGRIARQEVGMKSGTGGRNEKWDRM